MKIVLLVLMKHGQVLIQKNIFLIFIMQMVPETLGSNTSFCLYASAWRMFQVSSNAVLS